MTQEQEELLEQASKELTAIKDWIRKNGEKLQRFDPSERRRLTVTDGLSFGIGFCIASLIFALVGFVFWVSVLAAMLSR